VAGLRAGALRHAPPLGLAVLGFLAGRASIGGLMAPFGPAVMALTLVRGPSAMVPVLLAVLAGAALLPQKVKTVETALIVLLLPLAYSAFRADYRGRAGRDALPVAALVFGVSVIVRGLSAAVRDPAPMTFVSAGVESLVTALLTCALYGAWSFVTKRAPIGALRQEEALSLALLGATAAAGLSGVQLGPIRLDLLFGGLVVMAFALVSGAGGGAAAGVTLGVVTSLTTDLSLTTVGGLALAGLVAGFFREMGGVGVGLAFASCQVLVELAGATPFGPAGVLARAAGGAAAFVVAAHLLPQLRAGALASPHGEESPFVADGGDGEPAIAGRLRQLARVFDELWLSFDQIASAEPAAEAPDTAGLFSALAARVCGSCVLRKTCWEREFGATYRIVLDLFAALDAREKVTRGDFPDAFARRCLHLDQFTAAVNHLFEFQRANLLWQRRLDEARKIVAGQLRGVSSVIQNLAAEITRGRLPEHRLIEMVNATLLACGLDPVDAAVALRPDGRAEVRLSRPVCRGHDECSATLIPALGRALGQRMSLRGGPCAHVPGERRCRLRIAPVRLFAYRHAVAARSGSGAASGDSHVVSELEDGRLLMMISDGMGQGSRAAMESRATVNLLRQLIAAGFDTGAAVRTVNSILVTRSPEEVTSTVDLTVVDLYTGEGQFIKVGAVPSYLVRNGDVTVISASSLPLGILASVDLEQTARQLHARDTLVMVSDGVLGAGEGAGRQGAWIEKTLRSLGSSDPETIAGRLAAPSGGPVVDDVTVLVVTLDAMV
jgi:stage II sporulation protein E